MTHGGRTGNNLSWDLSWYYYCWLSCFPWNGLHLVQLVFSWIFHSLPLFHIYFRPPVSVSGHDYRYLLIKNSDQTTSKLQRNASCSPFSHFLLKQLILRDQYGKKDSNNNEKKKQKSIYILHVDVLQGNALVTRKLKSDPLLTESCFVCSSFFSRYTMLVICWLNPWKIFGRSK